MGNILTKQFYRQRKDFEDSCAGRDVGLTFPEGVRCSTDIAYADDGIKAHVLDIYRPEDSQEKILPVIINVHGGGLIIGNKEFNRYFCALLCKKGFLIYDQIADVFMAMDYIKERLAADGGDSSHVYMAGDSGGACLITYVNAIQNSTNIARAANVTPSGLRINALGLISGMFYTSRFDKIGLFLPKYLYGRDYKKTPFAKYVNPENRELLNSLAPVWLVTSHNDFLRRYTTDFEKALTRAEREHELVVFPKNKKLTHAFSVFEPFMPESGAVIDMMAEYLRKF